MRDLAERRLPNLFGADRSQPLRFAKGAWPAALRAMLFLALLSTPGFSQQQPQSNSGDGTSSPPQSSAQTSPAPAQPATPNRLDCPHSADPERRHVGCKDRDYDQDETLSHSWDGIRDAMQRLGLTPTISYTGVLQTNASGQTHQIWSYAGLLVAGLNVDLAKLAKVPGMSLYIDGSWGTGDNLSASLQNLFPVNSVFASSYYLGEMYLQQELLNKNLTLVAGRLGPANTFATLPVLANYVNYGLNPNPYPLGGNDITFFAPPTGSEWGGEAIYNITPVVQVSTGLFNNNLNSANGQNHGTDFALQQGNKGALVAAEVSYFPHQIANDKGKEGEYTVGVVTNNNSFPPLADPNAKEGGYAGVYVMGQEMVYQPDGPGSSRGLTVWGSWAYNSKPSISLIPLFWGAGASYQGLIRARKNDTASVGWIYGRVSSSIPGTSNEQVVEANYRWLYRRFLAITPDFQYIWQPGGYSKPGVAVAGIQASLTF